MGENKHPDVSVALSNLSRICTFKLQCLGIQIFCSGKSFHFEKVSPAWGQLFWNIDDTTTEKKNIIYQHYMYVCIYTYIIYTEHVYVCLCFLNTHRHASFCGTLLYCASQMPYFYKLDTCSHLASSQPCDIIFPAAKGTVCF